MTARRTPPDLRDVTVESSEPVGFSLPAKIMGGSAIAFTGVALVSFAALGPAAGFAAVGLSTATGVVAHRLGRMQEQALIDEGEDMREVHDLAVAKALRILTDKTIDELLDANTPINQRMHKLKSEAVMAQLVLLDDKNIAELPPQMACEVIKAQAEICYHTLKASGLRGKFASLGKKLPDIASYNPVATDRLQYYVDSRNQLVRRLGGKKATFKGLFDVSAQPQLTSVFDNRASLALKEIGWRLSFFGMPLTWMLQRMLVSSHVVLTRKPASFAFDPTLPDKLPGLPLPLARQKLPGEPWRPVLPKS